MKSVGTQGNRMSSNGIKNRTVKLFFSSWSARFSHFSVFLFMKSIHGELKALISPPNAHVGQLNCINCSISVLFSGLESIMMFMLGVGWQKREFPTVFGHYFCICDRILSIIMQLNTSLGSCLHIWSILTWYVSWFATFSRKIMIFLNVFRFFGGRATHFIWIYPNVQDFLPFFPQTNDFSCIFAQSDINSSQ